MAIIVVGEPQPRSKRVQCMGCGKLLEYLASDLLVEGDFKYVVCPVKRCKHKNYLGTVDE